MNDWTHRSRRITQPLPEPDTEAPAKTVAVKGKTKPPGGGLVPGIAGTALCVLLIMAIGLIIAQLVGHDGSKPGPGGVIVGAHVAAAVVGVVCYRFTRRPGLGRLIGFVAILVIVVLVLALFWWSPNVL